MAFDLYDVYFSGAILPDQDAEQVRTAVGKIFHADASQLQRLFSGKRIRIKRAVDAETAGRYRAAMRQAGALIDIQLSDAPGAAAPAPPPAADDARSTPVADDAPPPLAGIQVTEEGPDFDLLPPRTGSLADCAPPPPQAPTVDISAMALAFPGSDIDDRPPVPEPRIDISALSAAPPNTGTLEDCVTEKPPRPIPDISHLEIVDD